MRNHTLEAFFALIRVGLFPFHGDGFMALGQTTYQSRAIESLFRDVDWNEVYQLAQEQSVQGLVLQGIEWFKNHNLNADLDLNIPQILLLQWIGEVQVIEQQNKEMNAFVADLIEKLRQNDIYALLVKGQGIAQCYEKPLWRCSGDVDLFLDDVNYEKAKRFLIPLASSVDDEGLKNKHLALTIDGFTVELHGTLYSGLSIRIDRVLDEIKNDTFYGGNVRSWLNGNTQIFLLAADEDVVYVFTHILQHFYKGGIGLRQICDWCRLLWNYRDSLNHGLLESRLMKAGLMSEWKAFGAFAVDYLGMPVEAMPLYSPDAKWKRKADRICSFILEVGNFGNKRDMSYFKEKSYLLQKVISLGRRCGDLWRHSMIFPLDSVKFFPRIMFNGLMSAVRGDKL